MSVWEVPVGYNTMVENVNCNDAFQQALKYILIHGKTITTRNSSVIRVQNLHYTFTTTPLVSIRRTAWKKCLLEWEWFMSGSNNIKDLDVSVHPWWEPWADEAGEIANNYARQFRSSEGATSPPLDQIEYLIDGIRNHPFSRRNVITTWNTNDMAQPSTPITNCHGSIIQAFVQPDTNKLDLTTYQRSADMVLGVPHNWLQYWAFLQWLAYRSGREVGSLTWFGGDCHIYPDHIDMSKRIIHEGFLASTPPQLIYSPSSKEFLAKDFNLSGNYTPLINKSLKMTT